MYNAMASKEGTTFLHMDISDAVNIMTFAAPCADGSAGCAVWDIFRAEDAFKIHQYLAPLVDDQQDLLVTHPNDMLLLIHLQQVYFDDDMLANLYKCHGVKAYRHFQRPGDAVFIPAGCAHQVSQ